MAEKTALLVLEMQNDMLWEKRKEKFTYDTEALTAAVNAAIGKYSAEGCDVIYIRQIYPDTPSNHIIFGFQIEGTEGAALYEKLSIVSDLVFDKNFSDVYMAEDFRRHMEQAGYDRVLLCGIDECAGLAATAKAALQTGAKVGILGAACATRFDTAKRGKTRAELRRLGAEYL